MIRKTKSGFQLLSELGKSMSKKNLSLKQAKKRLSQIEFFKHLNK